MTWLPLVALLACHHAAPAPAAAPPAEAAEEVGVVKRTVQAHFHELTSCYEDALRRNSKVGGRVEVGWHVTAGAVSNAHIESNDTGDERLGECLSAKIAEWTFDAEVEGDITYPFIFTPK